MNEAEVNSASFSVPENSVLWDQNVEFLTECVVLYVLDIKKANGSDFVNCRITCCAVAAAQC